MMGWRWGSGLVPSLILALAAIGCGDSEPTNAPTTSDFMQERALLAKLDAAGGKKKGPARKAASASTAGAGAGTGVAENAGYVAAERDYFYDPRGKRDPFRSFRFVNADEEEASEKSFGPLADFELGQLELSAVIWDATNPRALIRDPGGRSYIVREGSPIGKNSGQVIHIGDNLVLVKETYENYAGETTTKDVELRIRLSQGG